MTTANRLVVAGLPTEMCVASACRAAPALDDEVVLVADGHSTYDTAVLTAGQVTAHHNRLLADGFVQLAEAEHVQFQRSPS